MIEIKRKDKCIGQRDVSADPMFIEFFTRPFTRFEFKGSDSRQAFSSLKDELNAAGWTTLDQS
ncbi:hypothetical protein WAK64_17975 [Bacillus spongiae]|uniref:Uncharacterized protein n=1 Tax=Bacillus spongiae TaxID=2683610 RepID=A0ABU8HIE8_9BACI